VGSISFVEEISTAYLQGKEDRNIPALRQIISRPTLEAILKETQAEFSDDEKLARRVTMHLCHKYSGMRLRKIGECFNVRDTAISEASRRFSRELDADEKLKGRVEKIKDKLKNM
jgi:chromosomal replication initiation ATPase DnaA